MDNSISTDRKKRRGTQHVACDDCGLFPLCNPIDLGGREFSMADEFVERRQPLAAGEHLFREGEPFSALYAVTSGALKLINLTEDGQELVVGFVLAGETLGQTGIYPQRYPCSAIALEDSHVCELPYGSLKETSSQVPALSQNFQSMMQKENFDLHRQFAMLMARKNAEQRLSAFLLNLSMRLDERGYSGEEFSLPMSRDDIANFLGLRKETLSRLFTKLHQTGAIAVRGKHIRMLDMETLRDASGLPRHIA
ncbi:cyclic nucleotide-binding domain-containing protein [Motiliproteus sediminis]|uniref:cyclic nucleotide-binding domain-containing protein n=1 Tax=Motiliproteus sediminis TaxID=1468178 RepID=UPI001AEF7546|nr:cyclic nucleotide-binding domain-containing protein [Motiliproteus sediminis]